ncbi:MAG: 23S rRNA (uracil(1939)-C(5))-methyltransferase RlmD [Bacteroidales bacterium]|nr:23S rRNA (uracil(1939)-C(5))-methyltransferase RlmD [Candidatus Cacconaster equi]
MSRKKKPFIEGVEIEAVAAEGNGLARVDGQVLFVQQAIPGDVVDVQVNKVRRGYMSGYVKRLVKASEKRVKPFCPHYGVCGGCAWQILPYRMQLDFKQQQVIDQLTRIGHLSLTEVSPILGSEKIEYYRNKLEYTFSNRRWVISADEAESLTDSERCGLGFHIGGHFDKVLDIQECHLQREPTNALRLFIRQYALENGLNFYDLRENRGFMRNLMVRTTSTGEVMLVVCFGNEAEGGAGSEAEKKRNGLLDAVVQHFPEITSLYYVVNPKGNDTYGDLECVLYHGTEAVYEQMEDLRFKIGPKSFYQTNSQQAYRLYSVVRDCVNAGVASLELDHKPVIYDLYTGTGTIALFLSRLASKVVGIEYVPEAIGDARINAKENGIENSLFFAGDMKDVLSADFIREHGQPDVVVLDPPRAGIHPDVADVLMKAAPERMVYVSCNPATQARDLAVFSTQYDIVRVQPVDMFPHTTHVENVVALNRRK